MSLCVKRWILVGWAVANVLQAELEVSFFADFENSSNGPAHNRNIRAGTDVGVWNARIRQNSFLTNGVLHLGAGHYAYQVWIPPHGLALELEPAVHIELLAATEKEPRNWNVIVFKDDRTRNLLSLRFNAWSSMQRWTGDSWTAPIGQSMMRGSSEFPVVFNELDVEFFEDGADIYYNGALVEKSVPYLVSRTNAVLRQISLSGQNDNSSAWYDNIKIVNWPKK